MGSMRAARAHGTHTAIAADPSRRAAAVHNVQQSLKTRWKLPPITFSMTLAG
jgi:hypothetical protein